MITGRRTPGGSRELRLSDRGPGRARDHHRDRADARAIAESVLVRVHDRVEVRRVLLVLQREREVLALVARVDARHPLQAQLAGAALNAGISVRQRQGFERAVGAVGPGVIRADETLRIALGGRTDFSAAVGAAIVEGVNLPVGVAGDNHPFPANPRGKEIAGLAQLTLVADVNPGAAEDVLQLKLENLRIGIN